MYNIYVTNKSGRDVYVCFQSQKISILNKDFHHELVRFTGREDTADNPTVDLQTNSVNAHLVRWGFCYIPTQVTMPFAVKEAKDGTRMYASLYANSKLWIMDHEVNCARYGCVFVESKPLVDTKSTSLPLSLLTSLPTRPLVFYLRQANPNPVWITRTTGVLVSGLPIINAVEGKLYFGRSSFCGGTKPCKVTTKSRTADGLSVFDCWKTFSGEEASSGELLQDTGYELIRAKNGDPIPPNAVIAGASDSDGTLYLGRVGGSIPCAVSTESDRIKYFCFYTDGVKQVESGEIVVLTK